MLKGHLDMIVLAALSAGPAHGYAVIEEIRRRSGQAFDPAGPADSSAACEQLKGLGPGQREDMII